MAREVAWLAIESGWEAVGRDGSAIGRVDEVVGDSAADIFNGLAVAAGILGRPRYVPAERVRRILEGRVELDLTAEELGRLEPHEAPPSLRIQPG